jgi:hypothetical protein
VLDASDINVMALRKGESSALVRGIDEIRIMENLDGISGKVRAVRL